MPAVAAAPTVLLDRDGLAALLGRLRSDGYDLVGPTVRDDVIAFGPIEGVEDLPAGWGDEQSPGRYRLVRRDDEALFGFAVGPHSPKNHLFPSRHRQWTAERDEAGEVTYTPEPVQRRRLALIGVRGCELAAIAVQDRGVAARAHRRRGLPGPPRRGVPGRGELRAAVGAVLLRVGCTSTVGRLTGADGGLAGWVS